MTMLDDRLADLAKIPGELGKFAGMRWRAKGTQLVLMVIVWVTLIVDILADTLFLLLRLPGVKKIPTDPPTVLSSLFDYVVGGRLGILLLVLAVVVWFGAKSRAWFFLVAWVYHLAKLVDLDGRFVEAINSRDTLEMVPLTPGLESWQVTTGLLGWLAALAFIGLLVNLVVRSSVFQMVREYVKNVVGARRISELILFWLLVAESLIFILIWVAFFIEGSVFTTLSYYSVLGRLVVWVAFVVLLVLSLRSRAAFLAVAVANFLVKFLSVDAIIEQEFVEQLRQTDLFFPTLAVSANYQGAVTLLGLVGFFIPVFLLWILIVSIGSVVRRRTRARIESWVDTRRQEIYGAEDQGEQGPKRVSILAVFALVFSIVLPVLGLVLAYAARNDMVASQPRKTGLDLAVAATIISWFVLGVQLLLVVITVVAGLFGGGEPLQILLEVFTSVFGWGALDPFGGSLVEELFAEPGF